MIVIGTILQECKTRILLYTSEERVILNCN